MKQMIKWFSEEELKIAWESGFNNVGWEQTKNFLKELK